MKTLNKSLVHVLVTICIKNKIVILLSILSFYLGCSLTMIFLSFDCVSAVSKKMPLLDTNNNFNEVEYAILILSGPNNEQRRNAIRETWSKLAHNAITENGERIFKWKLTSKDRSIKKPYYIHIFFVIGTFGLDKSTLTKLEKENKISNDLLLLSDFKDSYQKLTSKMLTALQWFSENLNNLKYIIKSDDDSFVRIDVIIQNIEAFAPSMTDNSLKGFISIQQQYYEYKGIYWGYFNGGAHVYKNGKWKESEWFLCDKYLPYALGGGYVISKSIVDFIAKNADFLSVYNSEDISMGLWTSALSYINRIHDIRFDTEWTSRGCNDNMLVRHKQTPEDMYQMYNTLLQTNGKKLCLNESSSRSHYVYNWNVLPSKCCSKR